MDQYICLVWTFGHLINKRIGKKGKNLHSYLNACMHMYVGMCGCTCEYMQLYPIWMTFLLGVSTCAFNSVRKGAMKSITSFYTGN